MLFPVSGVEINPLIRPLISLLISTLTSMGVFGAFLSLPFRVSIPNFTHPSVNRFSRKCDHLPLFRLENGAHHVNA